jgi:APA family basic amino acid/polyamine antiporter
MGMKRFFRTKSRDHMLSDLESGHQLHRALGAWHLTLLGIGAVIGAGIFVLTGVAAAKYAGPGISLSFVLSGIACAFAGLCYAEFASMIPMAGSAYTYSYATLGEVFAWIIGWDLILEYLFGASAVAVGWSGYVSSFLKDFGVALPASLASAPFSYDPAVGLQATGGYINLPAVFIVALMTALLVVGIKVSANFNNIIVVVKVLVILLFIGCCAGFIRLANWVPFVPENTTGRIGDFGWTGVLRGAAVVFFAYIGFDAVSTAAQESRNPQRDMPIGILASLAVCAVLYVAVSLVLTGIVNYKQLNVPDPIAVGINATGPSLLWLRPLVKAGAIAGLSSVIMVLLMGQPRIFYSMSKDGLLPPVFSRVHPTFKTPYVTTLLTGGVAVVVAGLFPIGFIGELVSIGALLAFAMVCVGVLVLRHTRPDYPRPFRTPWVPVVPVLGFALSVLQMAFLPAGTWTRLVVWMVIGLVIYACYGHTHSRLHNAQRPSGDGEK